jgi:DnaJ like chaperone protein
MSYAKWIGGALGWALGGGPIGGLMGFALGAMFDDNSLATKGNVKGTPRPGANYRHHTTPGDFAASLLVLSAAVMKADQKHMRSELEFIRNFFLKQFGPAVATQHMDALRNLLQKEIPLRDVCEQIRFNMEHPARLQLLHYLFALAKADGNVDRVEVTVIEQIAGYLGVSVKDYESIRAMFYKDALGAYKILEIEQSASDEDIKKAFRKMAMKYHPDKVRGLGEAHEKAAQDKFIKVQEAYEQLKRERGIK